MTGTGDLKSQCELRIGLGVTSQQDASSVFNGEPVAAKLLAKLKGKATRGAILVQDGDEARITPGKTWWLADDRVPAAARAHANLPADLDAAGAAAVHAAVLKLDGGGGGGYEDRWSWERAGHLLGGSPEEGDRPEPAADGAPLPAEGDELPEAAPARTRPAAAELDMDREFQAIVAQLETPNAETSDRYERTIQIIREAGSDGIRPGEITARMQADGMAWPQRTQIYRDLHRAIQEGRVVKPAGQRGRYFALDDDQTTE